MTGKPGGRDKEFPVSMCSSVEAREYIERHRDTMELLNIPGFPEEYREGIKEVREGGGKSIEELDR